MRNFAYKNHNVLILATLVVLLNPILSLSQQLPADYEGWIANPYKPGPNLPEKGRSHLDILLYNQELGDFDIPFPFSKLVKVLKDKAQTSLQDIDCLTTDICISEFLQFITIPFGRSLQKDAPLLLPENELSIDKESPFFGYPRVIVASQDAKFFLGYSEAAKSIEAISFNEFDRRYEFQVIADYDFDKKPRLSYATRSQCILCHKNHGTIFVRSDWLDSTQQESSILEKVKKALSLRKPIHPELLKVDQDQKTLYWGVHLDQWFNSRPRAFGQIGGIANSRLISDRIWRESCAQRDDVVIILEKLVQSVMRVGFGPIPDDHLCEVPKKYSYGIYSGLVVASPDIKQFRPLDFKTPFEAYIDKTYLEQSGLNLNPLNNNRILTYEYLSELLFNGEDVERSQRTRMLREVVHPILKDLFPQNQMSAVVKSEIAAIWAANKDHLSQVFDLEGILYKLVEKFKPDQLHKVRSFKPLEIPPNMPDPVVESVTVPPASNSVHEVLNKRCASCHSSGALNLFNFPTEKELLEKLKKCSPRIFARLNLVYKPKDQRPVPMMPLGFDDEQEGGWKAGAEIKILSDYFRLNTSEEQIQGAYQNLPGCLN